MEATIRANAPVLGMQRGDTDRVELTPFIEAVARNGHLSIVERHCQQVEATPPQDESQDESPAELDEAAPEELPEDDKLVYGLSEGEPEASPRTEPGSGRRRVRTPRPRG